MREMPETALHSIVGCRPPPGVAELHVAWSHGSDPEIESDWTTSLTSANIKTGLG